MASHRVVFFACVLLALPSLLWQVFDMYVLSLYSEQHALFFSLFHTKPAAVAAVLLVIPLELILLCQAIAGCLLPAYRTEVGLPHRAFTALAAFLCFHAIALLGYAGWSYFADTRNPFCVVGITLFANAIWQVVAALRQPAPPSVGET